MSTKTVLTPFHEEMFAEFRERLTKRPYTEYVQFAICVGIDIILAVYVIVAAQTDRVIITAGQHVLLGATLFDSLSIALFISVVTQPLISVVLRVIGFAVYPQDGTEVAMLVIKSWTPCMMASAAGRTDIAPMTIRLFRKLHRALNENS